MQNIYEEGQIEEKSILTVVIKRNYCEIIKKV